MYAGAAAERLDQIGELLVCADCLGGRRHVEDFSAQGQDGLVLAVAGLLGGAAGAVAFDDEKLRALRGRVGAVRELAR